MPGNCKFSDLWLEKYEWLEHNPKSNTSAVCIYCWKSFDISNMGEHGIISHSKSKKQQDLCTVHEKSKKSITPLITDIFLK